MLQRCGMGMGSLGLWSLLQQEGLAGQSTLAPKYPHFVPKAKSVIWIFTNGGPSQVDTWDYKPALAKRDGQTLEGFDRFTGFFANSVGGLMKSPFEFKQHGQCGKHISSIFPHLAKHVDRMAFIHSGHTESNNHSPALFMMNCGLPRMGYPCVGSWVTYGLGSSSDSLPAFVVMSDPKGRGLPKGHAANWGAGFLPSVYQGTHFRPTGDPIDNLFRPKEMNPDQQRRQLDLLEKLNQRHLRQRPGGQELLARMQSYELAFNMEITRQWAFSAGIWVKDMDQLVSSKSDRSGVYEYQVMDNGDFGRAIGIDFSIRTQGKINTDIQYTYSKAIANGDYDVGAFGTDFANTPAQEYRMAFDRTHDLTGSLYTMLPYGVTMGFTYFYQSGVRPGLFSPTGAESES